MHPRLQMSEIRASWVWLAVVSENGHASGALYCGVPAPDPCGTPLERPHGIHVDDVASRQCLRAKFQHNILRFQIPVRKAPLMEDTSENEKSGGGVTAPLAPVVQLLLGQSVISSSDALDRYIRLP